MVVQTSEQSSKIVRTEEGTVGSDRDRIERLIDAFERSEWREIDVRSGGVRVHLVAGGSPAPHRAPEQVPGADPMAAPADAPATRSPSDPEVPAGAHMVSAPSPGVFWRAPEPGAPPFAAVGDRVTADATLCIIEVMKLMSHLKAGVAGTVVAILAENGGSVAKDQPLFAIDTSDS